MAWSNYRVTCSTKFQTRWDLPTTPRRSLDHRKWQRTKHTRTTYKNYINVHVQSSVYFGWIQEAKMYTTHNGDYVAYSRSLVGGRWALSCDKECAGPWTSESGSHLQGHSGTCWYAVLPAAEHHRNLTLPDAHFQPSLLGSACLEGGYERGYV